MTDGETHVLVVEDDEALCVAVSDMLSDSGFRVSTAETVADALDVLSGRYPVDIVFADIDLSGPRSGVDLYHAVRRFCPGTPVLLTSGVKSPPASAPFIPKPYSPSQLLGSIASLLDPRLSRPGP